MSVAALLGASGIVLGAAGSHAQGGDLARLGSLFLLIHAGAILGLTALARQLDLAWPMFAAAIVLAVGVAAFSGDLAARAFLGEPIARGLAPAGGVAMIAGWLSAVIAPWLKRRR